LNTVQTARNAPIQQVDQQSLVPLNQQLAAAVIFQDSIRLSPRILKGENFIMINDMCDQVVSLCRGNRKYLG